MKTYADRQDEEQKIKRKQSVYSSGNVKRKMESMDSESIQRMSDYASAPFGATGIQRKMEVSQPGDASEVQADAIAEAMVRGDIESAQEEMQQDSPELSIKGDSMFPTPPGFEEALRSMKGSGVPLNEEKRQKLEEYLDRNLEQVRLHIGSAARALSESINARAFAHGDDIFFSDDHQNEELLAHEVTHTVQGQEGLQAKIHRDRKEIVLDDNVGKGQKNLAGDLRKIQDALYKLGYAIPLNEWNLARETEATIAISQPIPGTIFAITQFQEAHFSSIEEANKGWLGKSGPTLKKINEVLITLESGVGIAPADKADLVKNFALDVKRIQDAMEALGFVIPVEEKPTQEQLNANSPIDQSLLVETGKAIREFQKNNIPGIKEENLSTFLYADKGQTLSKINQKIEQKNVNSTFKSVGRTLVLQQPVGKEQKNRAEDVRSLQKTLILLGYTIDEKERVADDVDGDSVIVEANLVSTINAIRAFQIDHFGPQTENSKYGWVGVEGGQTLKTINNLIVILEGPVGNVKHQNANMSRDVLSVQEALRQLGYIILDTEGPTDVQLQSNEIIDVSKLPETIKAITAFQETNFPGIVLKGYLMPDGASVKKLNQLVNEKTKLSIVTKDADIPVDANVNANVEVTGDDITTPVVLTVPTVVVKNTVEVEGVGDDMDSNVDVNEKLEKFTSEAHQEPTVDYLAQVKKNRAADFTSAVVYTNAALRAYSLKGPVGESSSATANHKDDLIMIQDALVNTGQLSSKNAENERPAKLISNDLAKPVYKYTANTIYFKKESIKKTIAAIKAFQTKHHVDKLVASVPKKAQLVELGMTASTPYLAGVVNKKDATYVVMTNISRFSVTYTDFEGKSRKYSLGNFVYSGYTKAKMKDSYMDSGSIKPDVINFPSSDLEMFTDTGLTNKQAKAMMWVSANEGGFDALNTYNNQIISVGYAQLSGRNSFEKYLAMIKYREPELFKTYFLNYGIDVEYKITGGKILDESVKLYVYDPDSKTEDGKMKVDIMSANESDDNAKKYLVSNPVLLATFNRAIRDPRIKKVMIELTVRSYAFPAQEKEANIPVLNYVQVLDAKKNVVNEYFDSDATTFISEDKTDPVTKLKYSALKKAGRIAEPDKAKIPLGDIIRSEIGVAQLYDWAVHLNYPRGATLMADAIRGYAATKGYTKKSEFLAIDEVEVLKWSRDKYTKWADYSSTHAKVRLEKILKLATSDAAKKAGRKFEHHTLTTTK